METDLEFYTRMLVEELQAARRTTNPAVRRAHERLASTYALQMHRLENTPTLVSPSRLQPLPIAA